MEETSNGDLALGGFVVHPWYVDQFGHMNVRWYAHAFDDASFLLWEQLGLSLTSMTEAHGVHTVTMSAKTEFTAELKAGDCVQSVGTVARIGTKSITLSLKLVGFDGTVHATYETVEVFVDAKTHKSIEMPAEVRQKLEAVAKG